jgi:hypothetical protein
MLKDWQKSHNYYILEKFFIVIMQTLSLRLEDWRFKSKQLIGSFQNL